MAQRIRWGIAGPGRIAAVLAEAFTNVSGGELVAVGSRSLDRAEAFAQQHGIARAHGSYEALVSDPEVDAIYIATPHTQHTDIALAAIEAGKALLIEKAFTSTVADTERIVEAARARGVFVMEAMWTRFNPAVAHVRELVAAGEIGQVRAVHGDLTAFREYLPDDRLFNPETGGGAILDLGVYVISFAQHFLGTPASVHAVGGTYPNGVEGEFAVLLGYDDGRSAALSGAFNCYGPGRIMVLGTEGWIDVHPRFHRSASITVWRKKEPEELSFESGYHFEVEHVNECLVAGLTESPIMPLSDTVAVQQVMDQAITQVRRGRPTSG